MEIRNKYQKHYAIIFEEKNVIPAHCCGHYLCFSGKGVDYHPKNSWKLLKPFSYFNREKI